MESSFFCPQKIRKTLQSNSDPKAAGFGSPPSCAFFNSGETSRFEGVLQPELRRFRPRMVVIGYRQKGGVSKARVGEILGLDASSGLDDLLSQGLIYCDPSRELNFWRPRQSALLALGLRSHTDIPALKELEEWFDAQKEIRAIAKLDPFFERTSRLACRRLKRELERRGTLGEHFALEMDPSLKRIPTEESDSDLFRSDGWILLRAPTALSRRRALCRAARPKGGRDSCPLFGGGFSD